MTTATKTTMTREQALAALRQARAAMPDVEDLPRTLSQRQVDARVRRAAQIDALIGRLLNASVSTSADDLYARRDALQAARAAIEKQIEEARDWREVADARARDAEWERQQQLADAQRALQDGVGQWPNGAPMIPAPLVPLLTRTCAACGHRTCEWPGTVAAIEAAIAEREQTIADARAGLAALLASAEALLAEPVSV